jgi:indolepyruvate ferredoxin oxidoreductase beta subunit
MKSVTNIVIAGLGGQGILTASDIVADAAFRSGRDVKKAEVHGMSQRGGSVTSDVRYGSRVLSPMVTPGEADFVLVFDPGETDTARHYLGAGGVLLCADAIDPATLPTAKALNVAMLGALSTHLGLPEASWLDAIRAALPPALHEANLQAFQVGRTAAAGKEQKP